MIELAICLLYFVIPWNFLTKCCSPDEHSIDNVNDKTFKEARHEGLFPQEYKQCNPVTKSEFLKEKLQHQIKSKKDAGENVDALEGLLGAISKQAVGVNLNMVGDYAANMSLQQQIQYTGG